MVNMHKIDLDKTEGVEKAVEEPKTAPAKTEPVDKMAQTTPPVVDEPQQSDNNDNSMKSIFTRSFMIIALLVVSAGVATGFGAHQLQQKTGVGVNPANSNLQRVAEESQVQVGDVFGVQDSKTFKDSAEGYLEIGGINGEGSHKLLREGGESQTVYLTSSITDLDIFDGMEVKIWGETFKGQQAGWLMDVGRVEVVKLDGVAPTEE